MPQLRGLPTIGEDGMIDLSELDRRLQQCTPELFWAEGPISLGRWGKKGAF